MMRRKPATERIDVPEGAVALAERRTDDIIRACMYEPNIIRSIALSCYLQGLADGVQVVEQRPTLPQEIQAIRGQSGEKEGPYRGY